MAFVFRSDLPRPLNSGEVDGNFQYVEDLLNAASAATAMFSSLPAGLAGTSDGQLFSVPTGNTLEIFRNDAGAATPVSEVPLNIAVGIIGGIIMGRDTAAQVRADLGLGTAATKDVGESAGNVMEVGTGTRRIATLPIDAE